MTKVAIKCTDMTESKFFKIIYQKCNQKLYLKQFNRNINDDEENNFRQIAMDIKKDFDKRYKPCWHCIVGENFKSFVTHEAKTFIFFEINGRSILYFSNQLNTIKINK